MASPLAKYFVAAGAKHLSQVEVTGEISNQHEFNGVLGFREIFGNERINFKAKFIYLSDEVEELLLDEGVLTWYDAREKHPTRSEFRLYYSDNQVIKAAQESDLVIIAKTIEGNLLVVVTPKNSTIEKQLLWLFGLEESEKKFIVKDYTDEHRDVGYAGRFIISSLGIEPEQQEPDFLEDMINTFGLSFPSTSSFSAYARSTIKKKVSPKEAPDETLMIWVEREEALFRTLEREIVGKKLKAGFGEDGIDVDDFVSFSLSVHNRRKSRAGHSFEHNLAEIFKENQVEYSKGAKTERNNKPDFLFPNIGSYLNPTISPSLLTILGVKTTAKDRWRQVLAEADRIKNKHIITLEPAISKNQTDEMKAQHLQLIIPLPLFDTYTDQQKKEIISLSDFIQQVKRKESALKS